MRLLITTPTAVVVDARTSSPCAPRTRAAASASCRPCRFPDRACGSVVQLAPRRRASGSARCAAACCRCAAATTSRSRRARRWSATISTPGDDGARRFRSAAEAERRGAHRQSARSRCAPSAQIVRYLRPRRGRAPRRRHDAPNARIGICRAAWPSASAAARAPQAMAREGEPSLGAFRRPDRRARLARSWSPTLLGLVRRPLARPHARHRHLLAARRC